VSCADDDDLCETCASKRRALLPLGECDCSFEERVAALRRCIRSRASIDQTQLSPAQLAQMRRHDRELERALRNAQTELGRLS
jgi:hypothetical protein